MIAAQDLDQLSRSGMLQLMENFRGRLRDDDFPFPPWHGEFWAERERKIELGKTVLEDWKEVRVSLLCKIETFGD